MHSVPEILEELRQGRMIILVDDEDRENEGDLVMAGEKVTPEAINFMAQWGRGLICLALSPSEVDRLELPMMTTRNASTYGTAFTVSIEAKIGVTTGISAQDRARTIRVATQADSSGRDLVSPGHIFPLRARAGGVLERRGQTEGSVDLALLAGLRPSGVICEIMNDDGTMARRDELKAFSEKHQIKMCTIDDIIEYRYRHEDFVRIIGSARFPTRFTESEFTLTSFQHSIDQSEHVALSLGIQTEAGVPVTSTRALVRIHSECTTGDALGSLRCDCGQQLQAALVELERHYRKTGQPSILVYIKNHEGRGIGLASKVKAYELQDQGYDTVEANEKLGFGADLRHYGVAAQILKKLGIQSLDLLSNNPDKLLKLRSYGLVVEKNIPLISQPSHEMQRIYLNTKKKKFKHLL